MSIILPEVSPLISKPPLALKKVADALDVTTDYLLGNEVDSTIKDIALLRQFKEVDSMPDDEYIR